MSIRRCALLLALAVLALLWNPGRQIRADEWQPILPEELKMTSEPKAPGAPAIFLYRQVDRDDDLSKETRYARIKILTEEGRKQADVEIQFIKDYENITGIKARTIQPDGRVENFDGKIYEKTIVKARGIKYLAKTFTLGDVQVGSIIEYRFTSSWGHYRVYDSRWILSGELFTKRAKFSLNPNSQYLMRTSWQNLPTGANLPVKDRFLIRLEVADIAAFRVEDFMPPEDELKARVNFVYYGDNSENDPVKFWRREGKKRFEEVENFVNKRKAMEHVVAEIVSPGDSADSKLRKIYARVQQVRNTSFEKEKTEAEKKREKQKQINTVEDIWKNGYGDGEEITWLFLGLVRAAGFEAYPVLVSRRSVYFFNSSMMNPNQLNDNVVLVKLGGKDLYFDPGTEFTPFGLLPWAETSVQGLRLDKEGGSWVTTMLPPSSDSQVRRVADLKMTDEGGVEGKLTVTYTGLEALRRRLEERNEDDADRKKYLEEEVKQYVPVTVQVELSNKPDWKSSSSVLEATFDFKAEGWAIAAGSRALIPVGFFSAPEQHLFEHAEREHPIYFEYPSEVVDDIKIDLPLTWRIKNLPPEQNKDAKSIAYTLKVADEKGTAHISRFLKIDVLGLELKYYGGLRNYFQGVKSADEQQIVVQRGT